MCRKLRRWIMLRQICQACDRYNPEKPKKFTKIRKWLRYEHLSLINLETVPQNVCIGG